MAEVVEPSAFETYVGIELPLRVASKQDPAELVENLIAVSDGMGLSVKFVSKEEIAIDGKSAYDLAVEEGFVGTLDEWIASLKGKDGDPGPKGPMGQGIIVIATISQLEFDEIVAAGESEIGDAYLVDKFMYVFNGENWVKSPDLQGPAGRGLNYLGVWPDSAELPLGSGFKAGDTYVWRGSLWTLMEEPDRVWIDIGVPGPAGKSAYQIWLDAGNVGTQVEFLNSLKGTNGTNGKSAYQIWVDKGGAGDEAAFLKSLEGKSAYQVWLAQGNVGNEAAYIASLKGEEGEIGPDGKSAYQLWLEVPGNAGKPESAYFASLKGEQGDPAVAFTIQGRLTQESELPTPGDPVKAYYVGTDLFVWIAAESKYENFGALNGLSAYEVAVAEGFVGTRPQWLASLKGKDGTNGTNGTDGTNGQSAYQLWVAQPGNTGKSEAEFLESLEGQSAFQLWLTKPGNSGKTEDEFLTSLKGQSAYTLWLAQPGNAGKTEQEFLTSLKGTNGTNGKNLQVKGTKPTSAEILAIAVPVDQEAWVAADTGNLWIYVETVWADVGPFRGKDGTNGIDGKSAYELAKENNPLIGTEVEWLESLQGTDGKSAYDIALELNPAVGTEAEWLLSLKGTNGTNGTDGESAYQIAVTEGFVGNEDAWLASLKGKDGRNLQISGSKADQAAIEAIVAPKDQEAWVTLDTGHLFIYVADAWVDAGRFRGTDGTNGTNGTDGTNGTNGLSAYELWEAEPGNDGKSEQEFLESLKGQSAYELWKAEAGNAGKTEQEFLTSLKGQSAYQLWLTQPGNAGKTEVEFIASIKGERGTDGRNVVIKGSVADFASLPESPEQQDAYTLLDTLHLYMYINTAWVDLGQFRGDKGDEGKEGPRGQGINIVGEVELLAELPESSTLKIGDAYYVVETNKLYQVNDAGLYGTGITIVGPEGPEGPQGIQGETGTSIKIMGSYATVGELTSAVPTGVAGEGYLVGADLYLWGIDPTAPAGVKWYNAGPVRGPVGPEGKIGKTGLKGPIGPEGERGSLWLTLPVGIEQPGAGDTYGRIGDWAVNSTFNAFYRDPVQGWIDFGQIVAGDVNSPLEALGKVVREGTKWVALPIDAVPSPVVGTSYLRRGIAGGKTEWFGVIIPDTICSEVPLNTTVAQGRTSAGWTAVTQAPPPASDPDRYEMVKSVWTKSIIQIAPTVTLKPQCYQVTAAGVGSWVPVTFDTYSVLVSTTASSGAFTPNFANQQAYRVSTTAAPVITLPAFTTGRAMLAVFTLEGQANKASFVAGSGATIGYSGGIAAADIEYGATQTVITAFWNGFGTWIISKGPAY